MEYKFYNQIYDELRWQIKDCYGKEVEDLTNKEFAEVIASLNMFVGSLAEYHHSWSE